jgi:hypothetical protein
MPLACSSPALLPLHNALMPLVDAPRTLMPLAGVQLSNVLELSIDLL